jgi:predicted secreted protein
MAWRHRLGELIVPAIVLLGCLLYWLHVGDARAVARRVPSGVILFTVAMTAAVLLREFVRRAPTPQESAATPRVERAVLVQRSVFTLLCVGYFLAFSWLGFNLANVTFVFLACMVAGMKPPGAAVTALTASVAFYLLARVMEFNVPTGPFGL